MELYFISLFILIFGGLVSAFFKNEHKLKICAVLAGISTVLVSIPSFKVLLSREIFEKTINFSQVFGNINFAIDPISAFFLIVISFACFMGLIYANGYIKPYLKSQNIQTHSFFLMLLMASMLSVVCVQNSLFFLIMWELMSLSSFFLVIFEKNKKEVINAGIKYLVYMHISVIFIILAFALLSIYTNSYNFSDYALFLRENHRYVNIIFLLSFIGFGTKAGFIPFHNWLPDAHPAAPSHVSAIMSGVMIKTGIYGILRTLFLIGMPTKLIAYGVLLLSIISALWGVLYAISQHDIKKLLAYHSLENIGIIGIGIGIGLLGLYSGSPIVALLGFGGGILHILNHSIFKALLFFGAGNIYNKIHTKDIEQMGGIIKNMPYTSILFIIGSIAICALPPFNGFVSEFLIYAGIIKSLPSFDTPSFFACIMALSSLALIGTMAILCFTKVIGVMLLGEARSEIIKDIKSDVENIMLIPMYILAILTLLIGLFPNYATKLVLIPTLAMVPLPMFIEVMEFNAIVDVVRLISSVFLIILAFVFVFKVLSKKKNRVYNTWGCGYNLPNSRMQYTASSYADLFISTLKPLFKRVVNIKKPKELFPKEAYFEVEVEDIEEAYIVKPLIKMDEKFLSKFERIQNGNMQQYILFGLIFLIIMIVGLFLIGQ